MEKTVNFDKIFVESDISHHPRTQQILQNLGTDQIIEIDRVDHIFGRVKKPYLQKRDSLNLFLGAKRGHLVKEAPDAYGLKGDPHYYFIHSYNCIYECEYCYLQGYFDSPDIVLFVNHEDIAREIRQICQLSPPEKVNWFHAGEFSDSLALSHLTQEWEFYFKLFDELPNAKLELRTKSVNIKSLLRLEPRDNIVISFSLASESAIKKLDLKTPSLKHRLKAIESLVKNGYKIGIHLDPIIYQKGWEQDYESMAEQIATLIPLQQLEYISIGVVRFAKNVHRKVQEHYPNSVLHASQFIKGDDAKMRYPRPFRLHILNKVKSLLLKRNIPDDIIYLCME